MKQYFFDFAADKPRYVNESVAQLSEDNKFIPFYICQRDESGNLYGKINLDCFFSEEARLPYLKGIAKNYLVGNALVFKNERYKAQVVRALLELEYQVPYSSVTEKFELNDVEVIIELGDKVAENLGKEV